MMDGTDGGAITSLHRRNDGDRGSGEMAFSPDVAGETLADDVSSDVFSSPILSPNEASTEEVSPSSFLRESLDSLESWLCGGGGGSPSVIPSSPAVADDAPRLTAAAGHPTAPPPAPLSDRKDNRTIINHDGVGVGDERKGKGGVLFLASPLFELQRQRRSPFSSSSSSSSSYKSAFGMHLSPSSPSSSSSSSEDDGHDVIVASRSPAEPLMGPSTTITSTTPRSDGDGIGGARTEESEVRIGASPLITQLGGPRRKQTPSSKDLVLRSRVEDDGDNESPGGKEEDEPSDDVQRKNGGGNDGYDGWNSPLLAMSADIPSKMRFEDTIIGGLEQATTAPSPSAKKPVFLSDSTDAEEEEKVEEKKESSDVVEAGGGLKEESSPPQGKTTAPLASDDDSLSSSSGISSIRALLKELSLTFEEHDAIEIGIGDALEKVQEADGNRRNNGGEYEEDRRRHDVLDLVPYDAHGDAIVEARALFLDTPKEKAPRSLAWDDIDGGTASTEDDDVDASSSSYSEEFSSSSSTTSRPQHELLLLPSVGSYDRAVTNRKKGRAATACDGCLRLRRDLSHSRKALKSVRAERSDVERVAAEIEVDLKRREGEVTQLKAELASAVAAAPADGRLPSGGGAAEERAPQLEEELFKTRTLLAALEMERSSLQRELDARGEEVEQSRTDSEDLSRRCVKMQEETKPLRQDVAGIEEIWREKLGRVEAQLTSAHDAMRDLEREKNEAWLKASLSLETIEGQQAQLRRLEGEVERLEGEFSAADAAQSDSRSPSGGLAEERARRLQEELSDIRASLSAAEEKNVALQKALDSRDEDVEQAQAKSRETSWPNIKIQGEEEVLRKEVTEIEEILRKKLVRLEEQFVSVQNVVMDLDTEKQEVRVHLNEVRETIKNLQAQLSGRLTSLKRTMAGEGDDITQLRMQLAGAQTDDGLHTTNEKLNEDRASLVMKINQLESALEESMAESKRNRHPHEMSTNRKIEEFVDVLESKNEEISFLKHELEERANKHGTLEGCVQNYVSEIEELKSILQQVDDARRSHVEGLAVLKERVVASEDELKKKSEQMDALKQRNTLLQNALSANVSEANEVVVELTLELEKCDAQRVQMEATQRIDRQRMDVLTTEVAKLNEQKDIASTALDSMACDRDSLLAQLDAATEEIRVLTSKSDDSDFLLEREAGALRTQIETAMEKNMMMGQDIERLQGELLTRDRRISEMSQTIAAGDKLANQLTREKEDIANELEAAQGLAADAVSLRFPVEDERLEWKQKVSRLEQDARDQEEMLAQKEKELIDCRDTIESQTQECKEAKRHALELSAELTLLKNDSVAKEGEMQEVVSELATELKVVESQKLEVLKTVRSLDVELKSARLEVSALEASLAAHTDTGSIDDMNNVVKELLEELKNVDLQRMTHVQQIEDTSKKLDVAEKRCRQLEKELKNIKDQLEECKETTAAAKTDAARSAERVRVEMDQAIKKKEAEVDKVRAEFEKQRIRAAEVDSLSARLKQENRQMEERLMRAESRLNKSKKSSEGTLVDGGLVIQVELEDGSDEGFFSTFVDANGDHIDDHQTSCLASDTKVPNLSSAGEKPSLVEVSRISECSDGVDEISVQGESDFAHGDIHKIFNECDQVLESRLREIRDIYPVEDISTSGSFAGDDVVQPLLCERDESGIGKVVEWKMRCETLENEREAIVNQSLDLMESARAANAAAMDAAVVAVQNDAALRIEKNKKEAKERLIRITDSMFQRYQKLKALRSLQSYAQNIKIE